MHCAITLSFLGANTDQNSGWHIADTSIFPTPTPPITTPTLTFAHSMTAKYFHHVLLFSFLTVSLMLCRRMTPPILRRPNPLSLRLERLCHRFAIQREPRHTLGTGLGHHPRHSGARTAPHFPGHILVIRLTLLQ